MLWNTVSRWRKLGNGSLCTVILRNQFCSVFNTSAGTLGSLRLVNYSTRYPRFPPWHQKPNDLYGCKHFINNMQYYRAITLKLGFFFTFVCVLILWSASYSMYIKPFQLQSCKETLNWQLFKKVNKWCHQRTIEI